MLLKLGVDFSRLSNDIRRALPVIEAEYQKIGLEAVVTSTFEGTHSPGSLHYGNNAVDLRLPTNGTAMITKLKEALGPKFDVVLEGDHIHVEYDPK